MVQAAYSLHTGNEWLVLCVWSLLTVWYTRVCNVLGFTSQRDNSCVMTNIFSLPFCCGDLNSHRSVRRSRDLPEVLREGREIPTVRSIWLHNLRSYTSFASQVFLALPQSMSYLAKPYMPMSFAILRFCKGMLVKYSVMELLDSVGTDT
jgi:hypothetical protein